MRKIYKAKTNVSINVVLSNKKNLHISFNPLSNGSSTFSTDNEDVMNAIERHYNFGKLFRLDSVVDDTKPSEEVVEKAEIKEVVEKAEIKDAVEKAEIKDAAEGTGLKRVKVSDIASAKDYLADTCGISRTALRSVKAIMEQAAANGIEFYGMNGE